MKTSQIQQVHQQACCALTPVISLAVRPLVATRVCCGKKIRVCVGKRGAGLTSQYSWVKCNHRFFPTITLKLIKGVGHRLGGSFSGLWASG